MNKKQVLENLNKENVSYRILIGDIRNLCMKVIQHAEITGDKSKVSFAHHILKMAKYEEEK